MYSCNLASAKVKMGESPVSSAVLRLNVSVTKIKLLFCTNNSKWKNISIK